MIANLARGGCTGVCPSQACAFWKDSDDNHLALLALEAAEEEERNECLWVSF